MFYIYLYTSLTLHPISSGSFPGLLTIHLLVHNDTHARQHCYHIVIMLNPLCIPWLPELHTHFIYYTYILIIIYLSLYLWALVCVCIYLKKKVFVYIFFLKALQLSKSCRKESNLKPCCWFHFLILCTFVTQLTALTTSGSLLWWRIEPRFVQPSAHVFLDPDHWSCQSLIAK